MDEHLNNLGGRQARSVADKRGDVVSALTFTLTLSSEGRMVRAVAEGEGVYIDRTGLTVYGALRSLIDDIDARFGAAFNAADPYNPGEGETLHDAARSTPGDEPQP